MSLLSSRSFVRPTFRDVEHTLYILAREESDDIRNMILPVFEKTGRLMHTTFCGDTLTVTFFDPPPKHDSLLLPQVKPLWIRRMAQERSCYFRWIGNGIGLARLNERELSYFAAYEAHRKPGRIVNRWKPTEAMCRFANHVLYRPLPT